MIWRAVIDEATCPHCRRMDGAAVESRPFGCSNPNGCRCVVEHPRPMGVDPGAAVATQDTGPPLPDRMLDPVRYKPALGDRPIDPEHCRAEITRGGAMRRRQCRGTPHRDSDWCPAHDPRTRKRRRANIADRLDTRHRDRVTARDRFARAVCRRFAEGLLELDPYLFPADEVEERVRDAMRWADAQPEEE